jgi:hypothetical protein
MPFWLICLLATMAVVAAHIVAWWIDGMVAQRSVDRIDTAFDAAIATMAALSDRTD